MRRGWRDIKRSPADFRDVLKVAKEYDSITPFLRITALVEELGESLTSNVMYCF